MHQLHLRIMENLKLLVAIGTIAVATVLFSPLQSAYAFYAPDKGEVLDQATVLLKSVCTDKDYQASYGLPDVDMTDLGLGGPIPVYMVTDGSIQYADECYWPVLSGDVIVANVTTINNDDGTISFIFRTAYADSMNSGLSGGGECAYVIDSEGVAFLAMPEGDILPAIEEMPSDGMDTLQEMLSQSFVEYSSLGDIDSIAYDGSVFDQATGQEESGGLTGGYAEVELDDAESGSEDIGVEDVGESWYMFLDVPEFRQVGPTCWANSVASIGNYLTHDELTAEDVWTQLGVGPAAGTNANAMDGLALFQYSSSTSINSESKAGSMSDAEIKRWLNNGLPIYAALQYDPNETGHAVVVCGWAVESGQLVVRIMNPGLHSNEGQFESMSKNASGVLDLSYAGNTYAWDRSSIVMIGWQKPFGASRWAYLNNDGTKKSGLFPSEAGYTYYFDPSYGNYMAFGWHYVDGYWYYFDSPSGKALTGWQVINGKEYSFASDGKMRKGWYTSGAGYTYYLDPDDGGAMVTGWKGIGGYWYYFNSLGQMQKGWQTIGGETYYLGTDGKMVTGWQQISSKWYFFNSSGKLQTGWHESVNSDWFYLDPDDGGAMVTGWKKVSGYWYHFDSDGKMQTGWQQVGSYWYFLQSSGKMKTGWHQSVAGDWYYLRTAKDVPVAGPEGAMLASVTASIDGTSRTFNASGKCTNTSGL